VAPTGSAIGLQASRRSVDGHQLLAVDVDDAGPGMTEQQRHVAFTRFWQDDTQPTGTTGLGLAISRQLARASGGDLTLGVSPRGGLRATVLLEPQARSGGPPA
jgi:signal transduction histidine kinase